VGIRVLIVDDSEAFRSSLRSLLEDEGLLLVPDAVDGRTALSALDAHRPDVVLLDVGLPGSDGIEVACWIAARPSPPAVVLVSSRPAAVYGGRLASAPVRGFLPKEGLSAAAVLALVR
jgi:two-component system response regulator EvgA